jgi:hypothetical protein
MQLLSPLPATVHELPHLLVHSTQETVESAYKQCIQLLQQYSSHSLSHPAHYKKLVVPFPKKKASVVLRKSDVHVELDMSALSCNAKMVWNTLFQCLSSVAAPVSSANKHTLVVVCHGCEGMQQTLLSQLYYYLQDNHSFQETNATTRFVFFFLTTNTAIFPPSIRQCCVPCNVCPPPPVPSLSSAQPVSVRVASSSSSPSPSIPAPAPVPTPAPAPAPPSQKATKMQEMMRRLQSHAERTNTNSATNTLAPNSSAQVSQSQSQSQSASAKPSPMGMEALVEQSAESWSAVLSNPSISQWMLTREHIYHPMIHNATMEDVVYATLEKQWAQRAHLSESVRGSGSGSGSRSRVQHIENETLDCLRHMHECCRPVFHYEKWLLAISHL